MSLTTEQVADIAHLARLELTPQEVERFGAQLSAILDYAARLQQLDTSGIALTAQVTGLTGVMRDDVPRPSLPQDAALANAPAARDGFVVVPGVFEED